MTDVISLFTGATRGSRSRSSCPRKLRCNGHEMPSIPIRIDSLKSGRRANGHGLRRRKNCALFVAGMVTDLLVPSSVALAVLVIHIGGAASVPACSNAKLAVSTDGQETITLVPERSTESAGRIGR